MGGPWQDGQRAWDRLAGWYPETPSAVPKDADGGARALGALTDIGLVRRLLEHAELTAVRTARRQGKSWTDIAVSLGVTRQSAWERWRDVDEDAPPTLPTPPDLETVREQIRLRGLDAGALVAAERGRVNISVPNVIGMKWDDACMALSRQRLHGVGLDPNVPTWPYAVVTDQSPEAGAAVPAGSQVTLWTDRGGSGVREPRRPKPEPRTGRKVRVQDEDA